MSISETVAIHLNFFSITIPDYDVFPAESSTIRYLILGVMVRKKNISSCRPEWFGIPAT